MIIMFITVYSCGCICLTSMFVFVFLFLLRVACCCWWWWWWWYAVAAGVVVTVLLLVLVFRQPFCLLLMARHCYYGACAGAPDAPWATWTVEGLHWRLSKKPPDSKWCKWHVNDDMLGGYVTCSVTYSGKKIIKKIPNIQLILLDDFLTHFLLQQKWCHTQNNTDPFLDPRNSHRWQPFLSTSHHWRNSNQTGQSMNSWWLPSLWVNLTYP